MHEHLGLKVNDLNASARFYKEAVCLEERR
ncbi:MAG: hypothetical protein K0S65_6485 [Labilithrix sp.]|jgi:extradiol dioxygenase family protein|nr:hypothetical protein [Labilithrix sp.]